MAELIVALDFPDKRQAVAAVESLRNIARWFKIGLELFIGAGPDFVRELKREGFNVFLDLKLYDIPNTVAGAVTAAASLGADMLTLHCQGGRRMCEAAINALAKTTPLTSKPLLFGVTALTSFASGEMPGIGREPGDFGYYLANMASQWGLDGVVCSGNEAGRIKQANLGLLCLCPGIRPKGSANNDQRRTMTPGQAVAAGADFLVIGRPVFSAAQPGLAAADILAEMNSGGH